MKPFRVETVIHSHKTPTPVYTAEEAVLMGEEKDELEDKYLDTDMSGIAIG